MSEEIRRVITEFHIMRPPEPRDPTWFLDEAEGWLSLMLAMVEFKIAPEVVLQLILDLMNACRLIEAVRCDSSEARVRIFPYDRDALINTTLRLIDTGSMSLDTIRPLLEAARSIPDECEPEEAA